MVAELPFSIVGMVPAASKAAVEGLEKVVVENPSDCVVCLEEVYCSHLFHAHCIVAWLGESKFCRICRLELPGLGL